MIERGLGLLWDDADDLTSKRPISKYGYGIGGFSSDSLPDVEVLSDREDIRDQESTQACTGFGITDAARTACIARGIDPGPLSAKYSYDVTRIKSGDAKYEVPGEGYRFVDDAGAYPSDVMKGAEGYGFVREGQRPFSVEDINRAPDFDALQAGRENRIALSQWERISGVQNMRRANHALCGMWIAFTVTRPFLDLDGGWIEEMKGEPVGGHAMAIRGRVAVTVRGVKRYGWRVANSWGTGWGDGGMCVFADELFESGFCKAVIAIKTAPIRK